MSGSLDGGGVLSIAFPSGNLRGGLLAGLHFEGCGMFFFRKALIMLPTDNTVWA